MHEMARAKREEHKKTLTNLVAIHGSKRGAGYQPSMNLGDEQLARDLYNGPDEFKRKVALKLVETERKLRERASLYMDAPLLELCRQCPAANCNGRYCTEWKKYTEDMNQLKKDKKMLSM